MSVTRRLFLRHTAAATAVAATVAIPVAVEAAAEPEMTIRERAIWHMRELERLAMEDGASGAMVVLTGRPANYGSCGTYPGFKTLMIDHRGVLLDCGGMFGGSGTTAPDKTIHIYVDDGSPLLADDVTGTTAMADWEAKQRRAGA